MNRRNFIGSLLAAPAIVRAEILMPVTKIWTPRLQAVTYRRYKKLLASTAPICDGVIPTPFFEQTVFIQHDISPENAIANLASSNLESYATWMNLLWMERINRI